MGVRTGDAAVTERWWFSLSFLFYFFLFCSWLWVVVKMDFNGGF
jgi:hypothetical protein